jgi:hypothetical protein
VKASETLGLDEDQARGGDELRVLALPGESRRAIDGRRESRCSSKGAACGSTVEAPAPAGKEHSRNSCHLDYRAPLGLYIGAPGGVVAALTPIMAPDGLRYPARLSVLNGSEPTNQRSTGRPRTAATPPKWAMRTRRPY